MNLISKTRIKASILWRLGLPKRVLYSAGLLLLRFARPSLPKMVGSINPSFDSSAELSYKIVIVTFSKRFFTNCLPLIKELRAAGVNQEIFVGINGDYGKTYDSNLRSAFLKEISLFLDVNPLCFGTFQGLSLVWNRTIQAADSEIVVVLNDDIIVEQEYVIEALDRMVKAASVTGICLLNSEWSHFAISRKVFRDIGWFDERLLGMGEEDGDLSFRFEEFYGFSCYDNIISARGLIHNSSSDVDLDITKGKGKYSLFNWVFIENKYKFGEGTIFGMSSSPARRILPEVNQYPNQEWILRLEKLRGETDRKIIEQAFESWTDLRHE